MRIEVQLPQGMLSTRVPCNRLYSPTTYIFILWMVGSSLVLLAVATLFLRNQVRSLRRLAAAADGFGKGRPVPFFKIEGALEVRQAAVAFITMRDRIQRQIRQRTEMLAGVSHDLRTPLTRMKLALAILGDDPAVAELKSDVAEMEHMVHGYLDFARGEGAETPVETDIALLLEDVAAAHRRDGTVLSLTTPAEYVMPVRPNALRRCLANLIGNARRYGSHVWLTARPVADGVDILVDDDGPGHPGGRARPGVSRLRPPRSLAQPVDRRGRARPDDRPRRGPRPWRRRPPRNLAARRSARPPAPAPMIGYLFVDSSRRPKTQPRALVKKAAPQCGTASSERRVAISERLAASPCRAARRGSRSRACAEHRLPRRRLWWPAW